MCIYHHTTLPYLKGCFMMLNQSPNNLKGNPCGPFKRLRGKSLIRATLSSTQQGGGSCPLINPACPSAKRRISLQDCCIIQHSRGRKSVVWSHLSLGRAAKRKRWRRMRGRSERKGSTVEAGGGRQREVDEGHDGGGERQREKRNEVRD